MSKPNLYLQLFDNPETEQARLLLQAQLAATYIQDHAATLLPQPPTRILDLGTGPGFLALELHALYPEADVIGVDNNPDVIARAQQRLDAISARRVHFVVGNIQDALPPGPFDLAYASLVFLYLTDIPRTVERIYQALAPGGTLWIKDLNTGSSEYTSDPEYQYLTSNLFASLRKAGYHVDTTTDLPPLLASAGFTDIQLHHDEAYPMGGRSIEGESFLINTISGLHASRKLISRMMDLPEEDIEASLNRFAAAAQSRPDPITYHRPVNILARRPAR
jgi:ubiquinone/menaquinone biosynthesis C-methylase UbiE